MTVVGRVYHQTENNYGATTMCMALCVSVAKAKMMRSKLPFQETPGVEFVVVERSMQEAGSANTRLKRSCQNRLTQVQPVVCSLSHSRVTLV